MRIRYFTSHSQRFGARFSSRAVEEAVEPPGHTLSVADGGEHNKNAMEETKGDEKKGEVLPIEPFKLGTLLIAGSLLCPVAFADAASSVAYNPQDGAETLKTVAGVGYIILVVFYFIRLFKKRADRATSVRLTSSDTSSGSDAGGGYEAEDEFSEEEEEVTPLQCFIGFAQAGTICYLLYLLSTSVDGYFADKELPTQYTARNIAVLVQTVARGLVYLVTFIFGANAVGLGLLGIQVIVAPDSLREGERRRRGAAGEKLPNVKVTDDIFSIRRAFKEAEEMGTRKNENPK